jgi:NTE family protein
MNVRRADSRKVAQNPRRPWRPYAAQRRLSLAAQPRIDDATSDGGVRGEPTVAIVLDGGGARGVAHLGVLHVLLAVVSPQILVGKSAGALTALMVALGYSPEELFALLRQKLQPRFLRLFPGGAYVNMLTILRGGRLARYLEQYCSRERRLEDFSTRLLVGCTDLVQGRFVLFESGPAVDLVVASCSLPILGVPKVYGDMVLVDGGVASRGLPDLSGKVDADVVVGVILPTSTYPEVESGFRAGWLRTAAHCWGVHRHSWLSMHQSQYDLVIAPRVPGGFVNLNGRRLQQLMEIGSQAAEAALPELKAILAKGRSSRRRAAVIDGFQEKTVVSRQGDPHDPKLRDPCNRRAARHSRPLMLRQAPQV